MPIDHQEISYPLRTYVVELDPTVTSESRHSTNVLFGPPDGGWGWVVVIASVFASLIGDGVVYSFGVFTTELIRHFDTSRSVIGCIGSLTIGITLSSGPLVSMVCSKFAYRVPTIMGALIASIGFVAPFFYAPLWFLILMTSIVGGIGFGLVYLPSVLIVVTYFEKKRALALGIAVCGSGIGTFVLSPFIELVISLYGWQGAMLIIGGILLNIIPCGLLYRSVQNCNNTGITLDEFGSHPVQNYVKSNTISTVATLLSNPFFLLFAMSNFFTSIGFNAPYLYAKDRAVVAGISSYKSSFLISSIGIGNCVGRILCGVLATAPMINRFHLYNISLVISGAILMVSWGAINYYWMICYTGLFGLMVGAVVTLTSVVLVDLLGVADLNLKFGMINLFQGSAAFMGPPLAGAVYDLSKSYNTTFLFCGVFLTFSGLMMYVAYFSHDFREKVNNW